jgi:pimeloyl-ACP methyl ester carboxylesterase
MPSLLIALCASISIGEPALQTRFAQVAPAQEALEFERSADQTRAVLLIHGFRAHPFSDSSVRRAAYHGWQKPNSRLVQSLAKNADVFAFAYGQNVALERISDSDHLRDAVRRVRELGYTEIILVGHSAGGLIARLFVEDHPDSGITKVVQVCAPNGGSDLADTLLKGVRKGQRPFLSCLSKDGRKSCLEMRAGKAIPESVEFVCVVGTGHLHLGGVAGDGAVSCSCQWPEDLQKQGIPAVTLAEGHWLAMRSRESATKLAAIIGDRHPRWDSAKVEEGRKMILGKGEWR